MKQFDIVTIFPELIEQATAYGILRRGIEQGAIAVRPHDLRDYTHDRHRQVDDTPYGGGPGMVMKPEPFFEGVEGLQASSSPRGHVVLLSPQGHVLTQARAQALSEHERLIVICPRYEGVDERVRDELVDEELSIGDYVLSGAEFAALVVIDAVARLCPGVLGNKHSADQESHSDGLLEYPQYTRPAEYRGLCVPSVLVDGHHEQVRRWRRRQSLLRTLERRPDLLAGAALTDEDWDLLGEI